MNRFKPLFALAVFAAMLVVACEDSQLPTTADPGAISLAISDGTTPEAGGNEEFFFLPPIVPNPSGDSLYDEGEFNPYLAPKGQICEFSNGVTGSWCSPVFDLSLNTDETHYAYQWKTDDFGGLKLETVYRISVYIGAPQSGVLLGFRDVYPVPTAQDVPSDPETLPHYVFRYGSTIPIKVRIENGALCPDTKDCATKAFDLSEGGDLSLLSAGESLISYLDVPNQGNRDENVTLNMRPCAVDLSNRIDIPTYGSCIEIDDYTDSGDTLELTNAAIVTVCDLGDVVWPDDAEHQHDLVALHRWHGYEDGGLGEVEALPLAGFCPTTIGAEPTGFLGYAMAGLGIVRDRLLSAVAPAPLHAAASVALHRGMGGATTEFSRFQLALPSKMTIQSGDNQVTLVGTPVPDALVVQVTDLEGNAVYGARVRFETTVDPEGALPGATLSPSEPVYAFSNELGFATVESPNWVLGPSAGKYFLAVSGRGIAVEGLDGPRLGLDPYAPLQEHWGDLTNSSAVTLPLPEGELNFTATACAPGYGTIDTGPEGGINGTMADGEWQCAKSIPFIANLSGGSTTDATLYWMNDGENLYLAVSVARDAEDKVNSLRFEFDNTGDGRSEFDDVLMLDGGSHLFMDMFVDANCAGSKQSSCGELDAGAEDGQHGGGAQSYDPASGRNVYELWHPLNSGETDDIALGPDNRAIRFFLTLSLGKGAQGNTQWPAFKIYTSGDIYRILVP